MFRYSRNLLDQTMLTDVAPWDFSATENITAQIRHDKQSRQEWYNTISTQHYFYTLIEAHNPNQRVSQNANNPPKLIHGITADYDIKLSDERVNEAIESLKIKPAYVERSLGNCVRLIWTFPRPIPVDDYDFCTFVLQRAIKWLNLGILPSLDEGAVTSPSRQFCNGCQWRATGHGPVPEAELQAFFVSCGNDFRFKATDPTEIPLDIVEKALREKYPNFNWPGDFTLESQGPSFWVEGSTSPLSAIVKKDGIFTFSGHASKPFFSYADLLGKEFVEKFKTESISSATADVYWDSLRMWRKINGIYQSCKLEEFRNHLLVDCRLNDKKDQTGTSPQDRALSHIYNTGRIAGGAPFVFQPQGIIDFNGNRTLNIYNCKPIQPADEWTPWGSEGKFPWISWHFDTFFATPEQLPHFVAWHQRFYKSAIDMKPVAGQNIVFIGYPSCGKGMTSQAIIAASVGGASDASNYLCKGADFNSELLDKPVWTIDDDAMAESSAMQTAFQSALKKSNANNRHLYSRKYEVPTMVIWMGRVILTLNPDYVSSRTLGSLDNNSLDKISIFRCKKYPEDAPKKFPEFYELVAILQRELPYYLRWLLEYKVPDSIARDERFGYRAFHDAQLLDMVHQGSKSAPFKEILVESLRVYFQNNKNATEWRGTLSQLTKLIHSDPYNEAVLRSLRLEQTNRYMEAIQHEGIIKMSVETGELKTRTWIFPRFENLTPPDADQPPTTTSTEFNK